MMTTERFRLEIFQQMKRQGNAKGYRWVFVEYNPFRANMRPSVSLQEFFQLMQQLCEEGFFERKEGRFPSFPEYALTELGEQLVYQ